MVMRRRNKGKIHTKDETTRPHRSKFLSFFSRNPSQEWTRAEDELLREGFLRFGVSWARISEHVGSRSTEECQTRWENIREEPIKGAWSRWEDELVLGGVEMFGTSKWSKVAASIPGRSGKQCRERWLNHLDPALVKQAWTEQEDLLLMKAQERLGNRWCEITNFLPGRSENAIKNRYNSLVNKKYTRELLQRNAAVQLEDLAIDENQTSAFSEEIRRPETPHLKPRRKRSCPAVYPRPESSESRKTSISTASFTDLKSDMDMTDETPVQVFYTSDPQDDCEQVVIDESRYSLDCVLEPVVESENSFPHVFCPFPPSSAHRLMRTECLLDHCSDLSVTSEPAFFLPLESPASSSFFGQNMWARPQDACSQASNIDFMEDWANLPGQISLSQVCDDNDCDDNKPYMYSFVTPFD